MYSDQFVKQVRILLQCLPFLREQDYFVLKGGTAINLFMKNLPRLSVDIDLTYKNLDGKETSLENIQTGLREYAANIKKLNPQFIIKEQINQNAHLIKLLIYYKNTMIKIEPNFIMRGTLYPTIEGTLCKRVNDTFGMFIDKIPMLSTAEIYAGKICAALNRQHPRDFFDLKLLLDTNGISDEIRKAFIVYLACDSRPMYELLSPNILNIETIFQREFLNMTDYEVALDEILKTRQELLKTINQCITADERRFLISVKEGEPNYDLMPFENLERLPALQWKLINIKKMEKHKHKLMLDKLKNALGE